MKRIWNGDCTYQAYRTILKTLKSEFPTNYVIREIPQILSQIHRPKFLVRHDVTQSLEKALDMARLEHALGIRATYMIQYDSPQLDPSLQNTQDLLLKISKLGHEIGLHVSGGASISHSKLAQRVEKNGVELSRLTGFSILSVSFSGPPFLFPEDSQFVGKMINASSPVMMKWRLQDSQSEWELDAPLAAGDDPSKALLQIIVRPEIWETEPENGSR